MDLGCLLTDSHGLTHVTHSEATKRRVLGEGLDAHRLGRDHLDDGSVTAWRTVNGRTRGQEGHYFLLINFGEFSIDLPVRRSIFSRSSENLQAMWAVWQSRTGA